MLSSKRIFSVLIYGRLRRLGASMRRDRRFCVRVLAGSSLLHCFLDGLDSRYQSCMMMDSYRVTTCGLILSTFILSDIISTQRKPVQLFELAYSLVYAVLYTRTIVDLSAQP
ncbi:hypothetical protein FOPG_07953 [Fusarium oxysporum f. sp. conglutinans race 2 54008]|uniref:Uncharacterized protein n=1 Tax=Fusarium oxysporum f. sp. conglutinans race 2 54008 TaxID=1089457 RepID=X0HMA7_FUSOX|nr:hypothetical protein FOPG_07953 [Fusarium oxysporum f. sp. conglutinans race 2 54008]